MQCPNCRKIEKGQWLYANGSRSLPEFNLDDWAHDEDLYDLSYSELSFEELQAAREEAREAIEKATRAQQECMELRGRLGSLGETVAALLRGTFSSLPRRRPSRTTGMTNVPSLFLLLSDVSLFLKPLLFF